jgi:hypothetical protein
MDDYWTGSSSRRERHAIANPSANRINIITDRPNICSRYWRSSRRIAKMSVRRRTTDVSPTFRFFSDLSKNDVCAPVIRADLYTLTDRHSDRVLQCGIFGALPTAAFSFSFAGDEAAPSTENAVACWRRASAPSTPSAAFVHNANCGKRWYFKGGSHATSRIAEIRPRKRTCCTFCTRRVDEASSSPTGVWKRVAAVLSVQLGREK